MITGPTGHSQLPHGTEDKLVDTLSHLYVAMDSLQDINKSLEAELQSPACASITAQAHRLKIKLLHSIGKLTYIKIKQCAKELSKSFDPYL